MKHKSKELFYQRAREKQKAGWYQKVFCIDIADYDSNNCRLGLLTQHDTVQPFNQKAGLLRLKLRNDETSLVPQRPNALFTSENNPSPKLKISTRPQGAGIHRCAFTLAEVLITLGIIGVVAAMTISVLQQRIQKNILKNQIKKSYSLLSQTQTKVLFEMYGNYPDNLSSMDWGVINDAIIANFRIVKTCKGNALKSGCVPEYQGLNQYLCGGFSENSVYNHNTAYILADGSMLMPYNRDWRSLWLIDVNGLKGPNKAGYDLFDVAFDSSDGKLSFRGYGCLNQDKAIKGGLDDYKDIDNW